MKVHFLGIGGSGASAAAAIAQDLGFEISGCDLIPENEFTTPFNKSQLLSGHNSSHLESIDLLATTPAIFSLDPNNPELISAKEKNIPVMTWQQFLGKYLTKDKFVIAITGTHGKSTTTAMIANILEDANLDPTVLLGAINPKWKANFRIPIRHSERREESLANARRHSNKLRDSSLITQNDKKREIFIVEADEYNDNFLSLIPDISVVTNIEMDHPEYFKDFESYKESFKKFLVSTKGTIIANLTDGGVAEVLKIGMKETSTPAIDYSKNEINLDLKIPGEFNKLNAKAAFQVGLLLNLEPSDILNSLNNYIGIGRRFEYIGEFSGAKVYSDFGHHPTEIRETIKAVKEKFPNNRLVLIYQPHMFTRTKFLFDDFVKVFKEIPADLTFIMDIYQSREKDLGEVTSKQLVDTVDRTSVKYIGSPDQVLEKLKPEVKSGDVLFFMSAGDTDRLAKELASSH